MVRGRSKYLHPLLTKLNVIVSTCFSRSDLISIGKVPSMPITSQINLAAKRNI